MICESCVLAVSEEAAGFFDEEVLDEDIAAFLAAEIGADIADHVCDTPDECICACGRYAVPAKKRGRR